jgi:hypothetical protein
LEDNRCPKINQNSGHEADFAGHGDQSQSYPADDCNSFLKNHRYAAAGASVNVVAGCRGHRRVDHRGHGFLSL